METSKFGPKNSPENKGLALSKGKNPKRIDRPVHDALIVPLGLVYTKYKLAIKYRPRYKNC